MANFQVRVCVADLEDEGDAAALEKYYHLKCLRTAQRSTEPNKETNNAPLIRTLCEEQLLLNVQTSLEDNDASLNMSQVNDAFLSILRRYHTEVPENANYRKDLKKLISQRLPDVQFVPSQRCNESDNLVKSTTVSKAIDLLLSMSDTDVVKILKNAAKLLREGVMKTRDWSFTGSFQNYENPLLLQLFLKQFLFGSHVSKVSGIRDEEEFLI